MSWSCALLEAQQAEPRRIAASPAFDARRLTSHPTTDWITNGGNVFNQRYSPLTLLDRDNVKDLKALWRTSMGTGADPNNSGQAQILHHEGTLYVINGANDVFALDVDTGAILWTYRGNPDPRAGVPMGRSSRGVAMGEGKIFVGQNDAQLVALDQRTGEVVWSDRGRALAGRLQHHERAAVLRRHGHHRLLGRRDGEPRPVKAFEREDGKLVWTFYTVPGPGEFGHDTWPQDSDAWQFGGAPVWQTPAVDPELGLVYFSTGNPGPDLQRRRARRRQPVQRLDRRDRREDGQIPLALPAGASRHLGLRLAESRRAVRRAVRRPMRKGLVQVSKTGWAYILDRETGKPLIGIEERAVPQEPRQATAATQPYPVGDAIVPQSIDIPPEGSSVLPNGAALVNDGKIFTPFWTDPIAVKPGTMGGANWPPSSYDPETHLLYVCATRSHQLVLGAGEPARNAVGRTRSTWAARSRRRTPTIAASSRRSTCTTNKLAWRQQWREICYSGSIVTAGGLLFVGRNDGRLTALDKSERQAALGVHDGRRRQHDRHDVRAQGRAVRRRARGRRRVRGRQARRRHLDVLAGRHDEVVAAWPRRRAAAAAAPGPAARGAGRDRARSTSSTASSSTPKLASRVTASGRRRPRRRTDARRRLAARDDPRGLARPAATRCRPSAARTPRPICATSRPTSSRCWRSSRDCRRRLHGVDCSELEKTGGCHGPRGSDVADRAHRDARHHPRLRSTRHSRRQHGALRERRIEKALWTAGGASSSRSSFRRSSRCCSRSGCCGRFTSSRAA